MMHESASESGEIKKKKKDKIRSMSLRSVAPTILRNRDKTPSLPTTGHVFPSYPSQGIVFVPPSIFLEQSIN